jgi:outer membrane protein TolC
VLSAFQSVEDSLSASKHLAESEKAYRDITQRTRQLYASAQSQQQAGTLSEQNVLTEKLNLLLATQNLYDTQSQLIQNSVTLIKNLGGGWQTQTKN